MSIASNAGIIYTGNSAGGSTILVLPTAASIASPGSVIVGVAQRVVLTIAFGFLNITSYTIRARMKNSNLFDTSGPAAGWIRPGYKSTAAVDANLNVAIPVLSVGQNDPVNPGLQVVDHVYTAAAGVTTDYLYLAGGLAGALDILLTTAGPAPGVGDYCKVAVDLY